FLLLIAYTRSNIFTLSLHDALPISRSEPIPKQPEPRRSLGHLFASGSLIHPGKGRTGVPLNRKHIDGGQGFLDRHRPISGRFLLDRKSTRLNSSHVKISYAVFCLKK